MVASIDVSCSRDAVVGSASTPTVRVLDQRSCTLNSPPTAHETRYFERQIPRSQTCLIHAVNNALGRPLLSVDDVERSKFLLTSQALRNGKNTDEFEGYGIKKGYSIAIIQHALNRKQFNITKTKLKRGRNYSWLFKRRTNHVVIVELGSKKRRCRHALAIVNSNCENLWCDSERKAPIPFEMRLFQDGLYRQRFDIVDSYCIVPLNKD